MSQLWTRDVTILYAGGRYKQLVPTKEMTYAERVNAIVRLIILSSALIYLYNRDTRYLLYGMFSIAVLTTVASCGARRSNPRPSQPTTASALESDPITVAPRAPYDCTHPTPDNPFANVLLTDYKYNTDRPPACDVDQVSGEIKRAYGANLYRDADDIDFRKSGINSFYTMPDTTVWQSGREAFAQACYGSQPTCKEEQSQCRGW